MNGNKATGVESSVEPNRLVTRFMTAKTNNVSVINCTHKPDNQGTSLLTIRGQIGNKKLTEIVFDSGAAVSCLSASVFNSLDADTPILLALNSSALLS
jgi:hypothetical protein